MTAREYMNRPFDITRKMNKTNRLLVSLKNILGGTTSPINETPRAPSPDVHRFESTMTRVLDLEAELKELESEKDKAVAEITDAIMSINNPACEDVLRARYLDFKDWTTIAREMDYSLDWVFRLHRKGLSFIKSN